MRPPPQHFTLGRRTQLSNQTGAVRDTSSTQNGQPQEGFQFPFAMDMDVSLQPDPGFDSNYFDDALLYTDGLSEIERLGSAFRLPFFHSPLRYYCHFEARAPCLVHTLPVLGFS